MERATANTPAERPSQRKVADLQILRAIAASLVVIDHTFGALLYRKMPVDQYVVAGDRLGSLGVAAFFILSGLLMVRQTQAMFGEQGSWRVFAWRRISRIVPLYWLATLVELDGIRTWGRQLSHPILQVLCSFLFLPNVFSAKFRLNPLLGQGWTLNYEMAFYLLFAGALLCSRRVGMCLLLVLLMGLPLLGTHVPWGHSTLLLLTKFYTDPVLLLFAAGVLLGLLESRNNFRRPLWLKLSPAFLLAVPVVPLMVAPVAMGSKSHEIAWYFGLCCFGLAVVWLCSLTREERGGGFERLLVLLGDASYATYLVHLFVYASVVPLVGWLTATLHLEAHAVALCATGAVVAANLLGLAIHLAVERPIMRGVRRLGWQRAAKQAEVPSLS